MQQSTAQRKLVKSPPELWAEISSEDTLARHLAPFGEIRITRTQPETTVAWEGDRASGTVALEPAGWGTKVILTATPAREDPAPRTAPPAEPASPPAQSAPPESTPPQSTPPPHDVPATPPAPEQPRLGFFARLIRRRVPQPALAVPARSEPRFSPPAPGPEPTPPEPDPAPTLLTPDAVRTEAILAEVLDDLGAAHHRPFSRG